MNERLADQALAAYESAAEVTETALSAFNKIVDVVDWKDLPDDKRVQLKHWHEALQKAVQEIRNP